MREHRFWNPIILFIVMFLIPTCGKKGPPVPPRETPPPPVTALSMTVEGDTVILTWNVPKGSRRTMAKLDGFFVYRSKQSKDAPECKGCPILFTRIATVPYQGQRPGTGVMTHTDALERGNRYIYKVTVHSRSGLTSDDSNLVEFVH